MCTRIRFLGWAPGSRVPSQAPTIGGSPAAIMGSGMIANPGISVNPNQSPNDNARYLFMVDLLIELQPKSARSQSGITLFRGLSPAIAIEGRVPAARPHHANSARIPLYGILATTSIHPTLSRVRWGSAVGLSCGSTSGARASSRSSRRPSGPALREHAAVLLHQRPRVDQRLSTPVPMVSRKHWCGSGIILVSVLAAQAQDVTFERTWLCTND